MLITKLPWESKTISKSNFCCFILYFVKKKKKEVDINIDLNLLQVYIPTNNNYKHVPLSINTSIYFGDHRFTESCATIGSWVLGRYCWLNPENLCEVGSNRSGYIRAEVILWVTHFQ